MRILISSLKGGTGKSTLAFNLAVWLARRGKVAVHDLDPQATLSDVCALRREFALQPEVSTRNGDADSAQHVVIDSSVADAEALFSAVGRVDAVIVPVGPSQADVWSAQRFLGQLAAHAPRMVFAVLNRADTHAGVPESGEAEQALRQLAGIHDVLPRIAQRTVFRRSLSEGAAVFELEPDGRAANEFELFASSVWRLAH